MKAEEKAQAYADARLELLRPDIAADNYSRSRKMSLDVFDGFEVESAYENGYEQALKDLWHDANEKPNGKDYVIAWDGKYASIARYKQVINCKWCYLEDLLPKED